MYFLLFTNIVTYIRLYDMVFKMLPAYDGMCHIEMAVVLANVFVVSINKDGNLTNIIEFIGCLYFLYDILIKPL